jgi:hypothetical protein
VIDEVDDLSWVPEAASSDAVEASREVLAGGARRVDGVLLDLQTANAIVTVGDALSLENRSRLGGLPIDRAASIAWSLVA